MLLTLTTTHEPATDLGYLLHKHPDRTQVFETKHANVYAFYPDASPERCEFVLYADIDPVKLVRGEAGSSGGGVLEDYVNDRPYTASSMFTTMVNEVLRSAIGGRCKERPELAETPIPLKVRFGPMRTDIGRERVERMFCELGYDVTLHDAQGDNPSYVMLELRSERHRVYEVLRHLYVLGTAIDGDRHSYIGEGEVESLVRRGEGWLPEHPDYKWITARFLKRKTSLAEKAVRRLGGEHEAGDGRDGLPPPNLPERVSMQRTRLTTVARIIAELGGGRIADLGCGEGGLIMEIAHEPDVREVIGIDISLVTLARAGRRMRKLAPEIGAKVKLVQSLLDCRDHRWKDVDIAACVETIEHIDLERLPRVERCVFGYARPRAVIITTPNREYNRNYEMVGTERLRHRDHRFEWTREEFTRWCSDTAGQYGYRYRIEMVGPVDDEVGTPTQLAVFQQEGA